MRNVFLIFTLILLFTKAVAQDPMRFSEEIDALLQKEIPEGSILFTGSSSIRLWPNLNDWFPDVEVYNLGFGGSQMSDLAYYLDDLILKRKPSKLFIYQGDNDTSAGKTASQVVEDFRGVISRVKEAVPDCEIFLVSPKPSPSRWHLKENYLKVNEQIERLCNELSLVYMDVWNPMLDESGKVRLDIWQSDSLHMTSKGYEIWKPIVAEHVN